MKKTGTTKFALQNKCLLLLSFGLLLREVCVQKTSHTGDTPGSLNIYE